MIYDTSHNLNVVNATLLIALTAQGTSSTVGGTDPAYVGQYPTFPETGIIGPTTN